MFFLALLYELGFVETIKMDSIAGAAAVAGVFTVFFHVHLSISLLRGCGRFCPAPQYLAGVRSLEFIVHVCMAQELMLRICAAGVPQTDTVAIGCPEQKKGSVDLSAWLITMLQMSVNSMI